MANGNIINFSAHGHLRVYLTFGVSGDTSITKAREALIASMVANPLVLNDPAPSVTIGKLTIEGVELAVRPWCDPVHYWDVYFGTYEAGREALIAAGVKGLEKKVQVQSVS